MPLSYPHWKWCRAKGGNGYVLLWRGATNPIPQPLSQRSRWPPCGSQPPPKPSADFFMVVDLALGQRGRRFGPPILPGGGSGWEVFFLVQSADKFWTPKSGSPTSGCSFSHVFLWEKSRIVWCWRTFILVRFCWFFPLNANNRPQSEEKKCFSARSTSFS